jgi:hypothetical protein
MKLLDEARHVARAEQLVNPTERSLLQRSSTFAFTEYARRTMGAANEGQPTVTNGG